MSSSLSSISPPKTLPFSNPNFSNFSNPNSQKSPKFSNFSKFPNPKFQNSKTQKTPKFSIFSNPNFQNLKTQKNPKLSIFSNPNFQNLKTQKSPKFSIFSNPNCQNLKTQKKPKFSIFSKLQNPKTQKSFKISKFSKFSNPNFQNPRKTSLLMPISSSSSEIITTAIEAFRVSPATWQSSGICNLIIFVLGIPLLRAGLNGPGIVSAFLLGTLVWRAFYSTGFLLVATYFVIGTAATKVKMAQKEAQGVAEMRKGRRGPGSVIGSSAAGCVFALLSIFQVWGMPYSRLWELGFVASFCTKLSDTVSSEIGKAYGKTTYLVTTFKIVPRGTEGAVSVEGTLAGLLASVLLSSAACLMGQINVPEAAICVIASQIANLGESVIGALFQEKEGFAWLNNDVVNVINISMGSILAVLIQQFVLQN